METNFNFTFKAVYKNSLEKALHLYNNGLMPIPLKKEGKHRTPIYKFETWRKRASEEEITKHFSINDYNVGILAADSKLCIIDIDVDEDDLTKDGYNQLERLQKEIGPLPDTLSVKTPRGGLHLYFWDKEGKIGSRQGAFGRRKYSSIDTVGGGSGDNGGLIISPFNTVPHPYNSNITSMYEIANFSHIAEIPTSYIEKWQAIRAENSTSSQVISENKPIPVGERHETFKSLAVKLRKTGLEEDAIFAALCVTNESKSEELYSESSLEDISAWAARNITPDEAESLLKLSQAQLDFQDFKAEKKDPEVLPPRANRFLNVRFADKFDTKQIEPIDWLLINFFIRKKVTITASRGGLGKSLEAICLGVSLASGINFLNLEGLKKCRVWFHNAEDDDADNQRRVSAVRQHYSIPQDAVSNLVHTSSEEPSRNGNGIGHLVLATIDPHGNFFPIDEAINDVIKFITENDIDLWIVDPLAKISNVPENSNSLREQLMRVFNKIAQDANCSIAIVAHSSKDSYDKKGHSPVRGAGSQQDSARITRQMQDLTDKEVETLFDEKGFKLTKERASQMCKVFMPKNNFGKLTSKCIYYEKISVECEHKKIESVGVLQRVYLSEDCVQLVQKNELPEYIIRRKQLVDRMYKFLFDKGLMSVSVNEMSKYLANRGLMANIMKIGRHGDVSPSRIRTFHLPNLFFKNPDNDPEQEGYPKLLVPQCMKPTFLCFIETNKNGRPNHICIEEENHQELLV